MFAAKLSSAFRTHSGKYKREEIGNSTMKTIQYRLLAALITIMIAGCGMAPRNDTARTAIIGAFGDEVLLIEQRLENAKTDTVFGLEFRRGILNGREVVVTRSGVGKVNASMTTSILLHHFCPSEVIFTGIAGGLNPALLPGDIVIAEALAQHDLGDIFDRGFIAEGAPDPVNGGRNPVFIASDSALVMLALGAADSLALAGIAGSTERAPSVVKGKIVTGDVFVASDSVRKRLRDRFGADAVEMEGAAVAQVCRQQRVPFVVIRSLSDNADQSAASDLRRFYETAANNSAELVCGLVSSMHKNRKITENSF
ncbi:MAG: 5'-methylthioadenosine/adenosylhomocysteine nucleosidase [candidate division KSB1 bacterium]|jgi:adenosylhomocysteine nucleosidase|nr:5'-methylthioadenosine/adenosylhomocysteine nucleosidase [candidate division KSB1 bacterium]